VVIARTTSTARGAALDIRTTDIPSKSYAPPILWLPTVDTGSARLTLGHVSRMVLNIA